MEGSSPERKSWSPGEDKRGLESLLRLPALSGNLYAPRMGS